MLAVTTHNPLDRYHSQMPRSMSALRRLATLTTAARGVTLAACTTVLSCTTSTDPTPARPLVLCSSQVAITVGKSLPQTVAWLPRCGATYLEVTSPDGQTVYWIVQSDTGRFPPPVRYGITPDGMRSAFGPVPLRQGQPYLVRLGLIIDENSFAVIGEQLFTN